MMELSDLSVEQLQELFYAKNYSRPGDTWVPNAAQANFIKMVGGGFSKYEEHWTTRIEATDNKDNFINLFVGANGSGKTDVLCHIAGTLLGCVNNPFFRNEEGLLYPFFRYPPAGGRGRIVSNATTIRDVILPRLLEILPEGSYEKDKKGKDFYSEFTGPRGRKFNLMTYEQEVKEFRSVSLGWCFFDEPEERPEIFKETTARFRKGGKIMFDLTPLGESAWVYDLTLGNTNWSVGAVYADIEANCIQHGIRGILEHRDIERMIAGWPEDERAARVHAQWMHLRNLVYPTFDRRVHVVHPREIPEEGTIYCAMDPHDRRPPFIGWFRACPDGRLYMIREWPTTVMHKEGGAIRRIFYEDMQHDDRTIDDYADAIKRVESEIGKSRERVMDARFGNKRYPNSGNRVFEEYCERGVDFDLAGVDPTLARGHAKVKLMLQHNMDKARGPIVLPRLFISQECENTIRAFERYRYKVSESGREMVEEDHKDPMDVIRMAVDMDSSYQDVDLHKQLFSIIPEIKDKAFAGLN